MIQSILLVGFGGAIGSILRFAISRVEVLIQFPILTLLINILGSFVIGLVIGVLGSSSDNNSQSIKQFVAIGFCGGFTTFSTFSFETVSLLESGKYLIGGLYILLSVSLCIIGTIIGLFIGRSIVK
jgi:CrcB protein